MPQIAIEPVDGGFEVLIDGQAVRFCGDELDAHHWGKHAFEAADVQPLSGGHALQPPPLVRRAGHAG